MKIDSSKFYFFFITYFAVLFKWSVNEWIKLSFLSSNFLVNADANFDEF